MKVIQNKPKTNGSRRLPQETSVPAIEIGEIVLTIRGEESLICHQWSEKAKREMLSKQTKKAQTAKEVRDPFADFVSSLYILNRSKMPKTKLVTWDSWPYAEGTFGFPVIAFKSATIAACRLVNGITMTLVKSAIRVPDGLLPLKYDKLVMREDMVRIGTPPRTTASLCYRGEFTKWSVELPIKFMKNVINVEQIVSLLNHAGFGIGVGEWRPSSPKSSGIHGTFTVEAK